LNRWPNCLLFWFPWRRIGIVELSNTIKYPCCWKMHSNCSNSDFCDFIWHY
jgi:hypothetical protein